MPLNSVVEQVNLIHHYVNEYRIKCENVVNTFDKNHAYFFRELNNLFKQTENNYHLFKNNKFYNYFVEKLNLVFAMFNSDSQDKNIYNVLNQLINECEDYLKELEFIIKELDEISDKI
jgi:hypothetical protein